jgi:hypothetical protein
VIKLRVAGLNVRTLREGAIGCQEALAVFFHTKVGTEVTAAIHDVLTGVIEVR